MQTTETLSNTKIYQKPIRFFEDSGAVNPKASYYILLDNVTNTKKQDMKSMVDQGRYFSMFAPRQSGKTTFFKRMRDQLHKDRMYIAIVLSFQQYQGLDKSQFYANIEEQLYKQLLNRLKEVGCEKYETIAQFLENFHLLDHLSFGKLFRELNEMIQFKKIVIFIDEFDGIPIDELGSFLMTLRDLYQDYKEVKRKALYSIALVGIRNITKLVVGGVSPFNIADQVDLPPFSLKNVRDLYDQYTVETNQPFSETAVNKVHTESGGQTWLVNRLATILTVNIKPQTVEPIDEPDVDKAIQILIKERNSHFDNLDEKAKLYKETFVEIVFDGVEYNPGNEEQTWLEQFGLIKNREGKAVVANNIYKMRYLRIFFDEVAKHACPSPQSYILPDSRLNMESILQDFSNYIAQIGVRAFYETPKNPYEKTGQFLLTAVLYQFVKGGEGDLRYEANTGLGRMDIILIYKGRKYIIETKVHLRGDKKSLIQRGVEQVTKKYLATEPNSEGFLVIFDAGTAVGTSIQPKVHSLEGKNLTCFIICIGYSNLQLAEPNAQGIKSAPMSTSTHTTTTPSMENPFTDTHVILDQSRFIGRSQELKTILKRLQNGIDTYIDESSLIKGCSVAIIGVPKIGKSSILWHLKKEWEKADGGIIGPINMETVDSAVDFFNLIAEAAGVDTGDWPTLRKKLLAFRGLLIIDELDIAPQHGVSNKDMSKLRGIIQENRDIKVVAASRVTLKKVYKADEFGSFPTDFLEELPLGQMAEEECRLLLEHPWEPQLPQFDRQTSETLLTMADYFPYKLQRAAFHRYEALTNTAYDWQEGFHRDMEQLS